MEVCCQLWVITAARERLYPFRGWSWLRPAACAIQRTGITISLRVGSPTAQARRVRDLYDQLLTRWTLILLVSLRIGKRPVHQPSSSRGHRAVLGSAARQCNGVIFLMVHAKL